MNAARDALLYRLEEVDGRERSEEEGSVRTGTQLDLRLGDSALFRPPARSSPRPVSCVESTVGGVESWKC